MNINNNCNLVLSDVYLYDIHKCHYTILKRLGYNLDLIDEYDKITRNIQIGYLMKNKQLTSMLRLITNSLVNEFIIRNNIKDDEIICRQYDGIIIIKPATLTNQYIDFDLRDIYEFMIISINYDNYIAINDKKKIIIKGVPNRNEYIDSFLYRVLNINFASKISIFKSMFNIKNDIIYSESPELFCIPNSDDKYSVILKRYGTIKISETIVDMLDVDEIDRYAYFEIYIKPFFDSIVKEYI